MPRGAAPSTACERSLTRLKTDHLDVYLLHWRGAEPIAETLEAFAALKQAGKILDYGVSNFDTDEMEEAAALPGGGAVATNQVLYNLMNRGIEWDLLPWCRSRSIPVMAYSPFVSAPPALTRLLGNAALKAVAARHAATPAQIALAWLLHQPGVVAIPKAVQPAHVRANRAASRPRPHGGRPCGTRPRLPATAQENAAGDAVVCKDLRAGCPSCMTV